jgi:trehalose 6-phosphate phosphatase
MNLLDAMRGKKLAFFLDYDGTLTPIVSRPEVAQLTREQREILRQLSEKYPVAIISGRDRQDVEALVGLPHLIYAGSHGFDIAGPNGLKVERGDERTVTEAEKALQPLKKIPHLILERKKYAIAIHYRQCDPAFLPQIEQKVKEVQTQFPALRMKRGKMVLELQPDIDWDKGKAVLHLIDLMKLGNEVHPVYIGDDTTDEDAFLALKGRGITIGLKEKTAALYQLKNPEEVYHLFQSLLTAA